MATRIRLRYDDRSVWDTQDPELLAGEFAVAKETDDTITVRVGIESTPPVTWSTAPEISTSGVPGGGIDFDDLDPGEVLYWDGTQWFGRGLDELIGGGNRISVSRNTDGTININYFETTFTASFSASGSFTTEEVYTNNDNYTISTTATATKGGSSTVGVQSITANTLINFTSSPGFPIEGTTANNGTTAVTSSFTLTPNSVSTWFGVGSQSASFRGIAESITVDDDGNPVDPALVFPSSGASTIASKAYQWRIFGFTSDTELTAAEIDGFVSSTAPATLNTLYTTTALNEKTTLYNLGTSPINVFWNYGSNTIQGNSPSSRYVYILISSISNKALYNWSSGLPQAFFPYTAILPETGFAPVDSNNVHATYTDGNLKTYSYRAFTIKSGENAIPYSANSGQTYFSGRIEAVV